MHQDFFLHHHHGSTSVICDILLPLAANSGYAFMKKYDLYFALFMLALFLPFVLSAGAFAAYEQFNRTHGMVMSFVKFALLATLGEMLGLRIKTGLYFFSGFGIIPRALVWGFLGLAIKAAFIIFASGTPVFLEYLGMNGAGAIIQGDFTFTKVLVAFCISAAMNLTFAPVMMTFHKVTDTHILQTGGTLSGFLSPLPARKIITGLNWDVQWSFVFCKTIPFFWIPAHTITFLLPPDYQVLFAALLGLALGVILAIAGQMGRKASMGV